MAEATDYTPEPARSYYGPGFVCSTLQITPAQLRVLMEGCGARFAIMIDGVPYLDGDGFEAVSEKCSEVRAEIRDKMGSAGSN